VLHFGYLRPEEIMRKARSLTVVAGAYVLAIAIAIAGAYQ